MKTPEGGERLECLSFYGTQRVKMSIGLEGECGRNYYEYDYDIDYLDNGMAYVIMPEPKRRSILLG